MSSLKNYRFRFLPLVSLLAMSAVCGMSIASAEDPFVDEFDGPELDPSWSTFDNEGGTQEGFTEDGEYEIIDSLGTDDAGIGRSMSGSGDFTADASIRLEDFFEGSVDFKFRFLAPKFMELVFNQTDFMRVFSGERGGNTVTIPTLGYEEGSKMHIRFSWTEASGTMRIGVALGDEPMNLITTIDGLEGFQPTRADLVLFKIGEGGHTPRLFIDRFEVTDEALSVGIPPFVDDFSGPELAEGWAPLDDEDGATQIGFSDGIYEVRDNQEGGDAGLRRPVGGLGSFTADAKIKLLDFAGSNTDFKFRFLGGKFMELIYNSFGDLRVFSGETGGNVAQFQQIGLNDGDVLDLRLAFDALSGTVQVSVGQNGGTMTVLAEVTELADFAPENVDLLLFKFGEGNGNAPRLQLDRFAISEGYLPVVVEPFLDEFDGPDLNINWATLDAEGDTQIGFNEAGQYEIKDTQLSDDAGLRLRLPAPGSMTADVSVRLEDFVGSESDFRVRFPGTGAIEVILDSAAKLTVLSGGTEIASQLGFDMVDGDTLDIRVTHDEETTDLQVGVGLNGEGLNALVNDFGFDEFAPRALEIALAKDGEGNGKNPRMLLDRASVRQGFSPVPVDQIEAFVDTFDGPDLEENWSIQDEEGQLGFEDGAYGISDPSTSSANSGIQRPIFGEGSFTVNLKGSFEDFNGSNSDFKFRFFGGQFIELVHNSFDDVRMHSGEKGAINRIEDIGILDGDDVQFRFVWNEPLGKADYGVSINGADWILIGSVSGLAEFLPNSVDFVFFKFGDGNGLAPKLFIDRFEIRPGVFDIPLDPADPIQPFADAFDGPNLDEGWSLIDDTAEAQIGFADGSYEMRDSTTSAGDVGIRRSVVGMGSFTADLMMTLDDFSGSNTDFKFRFFGGQFIEVVYNSFDDIRVFSGEKGENVNLINGVGITDGAPLHFRFIWNEGTGDATVGLAIGDDPMMEIAVAEGLQEFTPDTVDFVMFKFGDGNGMIPKLLLDNFEIREGVIPIPPLPTELFVDTFDGPELLEGWTVRDASAEAQIGFTEDGRYQINEPSTSADGDAGIQRPIIGGGSFTADLEMAFQDFAGSNTDFKFRFFGGQFIELVYNSFDDIRVFSGEKGDNVNRINGIGITDDTPLHFRFIFDADTGDATYGLAIGTMPMVEIATAEGLMEFTPNTVDFVMFKFGEGNGNTPKMLIDRSKFAPASSQFQHHPPKVLSIPSMGQSSWKDGLHATHLRRHKSDLLRVVSTK